ncbi:hypothetical protein G9A89_001100 [Geosiphon pyriformis]|nr:hypothetical protein G9A89_001100 [Geosiphon pyriformis]
MFNNRPVNKLVFPSMACTFGAASTSFSKKMVKKTKSSEKWRQLLAFAIVTPNPFVISNKILNEIFIASFSILFKISQDQPLAVLSNMVSSGRLLSVLEAKQFLSIGSSVLENWTNQIETESMSLEAIFLVELTSFVHLATLKIAKSLVVPESDSLSAAIVLHNVPLGVFAADIKTVLSVFDVITCVVLKSAGIWQYAVIYFENLVAVTSALNHWFKTKLTSVLPVFSEFPLLVAVVSPVAIVDPLVFSQLASLESDLAKLSVLVESIVKPVGSMVKVFEQFVNGNLVSSFAFGLRVNEVLVYISIFSRAVGKLE